MHTEHLRNVRPFLVAAGWLIAAAAASLTFLAFVAIGLVGEGAESTAETVVAAVAIGVGFGVGGFVAGFRALHAPILHGVAIGLASLVAWFILNVATVVFFEDAAWTSLSAMTTLALLLEQVVSAIAGAWIGYGIALRGQPEPAE